jgi:hypothetical protein
VLTDAHIVLTVKRFCLEWLTAQNWHFVRTPSCLRSETISISEMPPLIPWRISAAQQIAQNDRDEMTKLKQHPAHVYYFPFLALSFALFTVAE